MKLLNWFKSLFKKPLTDTEITKNYLKQQGLTSFSEYVNFMVKGLEKEWIKVDMNTFAVIKNNVCIGCAATNALCEIQQRVFLKENIENWRHVDFNHEIKYRDFNNLEMSYDYLRRGSIYDCIETLKNIQHILPFKVPVNVLEVDPEFILPVLTNNNYKDHLSKYKDYVKWLKLKGL